MPTSAVLQLFCQVKQGLKIVHRVINEAVKALYKLHRNSLYHTDRHVLGILNIDKTINYI